MKPLIPLRTFAALAFAGAVAGCAPGIGGVPAVHEYKSPEDVPSTPETAHLPVCTYALLVSYALTTGGTCRAPFAIVNPFRPWDDPHYSRYRKLPPIDWKTMRKKRFHHAARPLDIKPKL